VRTLQTLSTGQHVTVIVVTHAEEVARFAARRVRLRDGRVVGDDAQLAPVS
jgi:ABC-type lipoprotein export system ATPase subunit